MDFRRLGHYSSPGTPTTSKIRTRFGGPVGTPNNYGASILAQQLYTESRQIPIDLHVLEDYGGAAAKTCAWIRGKPGGPARSRPPNDNGAGLHLIQMWGRALSPSPRWLSV